MSDYLLWVNPERTVLVRWWTNNSMEVATRPEPGATWGPPIKVEMEASR
jgi:hypothetical protein